MKVGILTFHEVFNPGAFWQAIGTQTLMRGLGHEAYVINYNPPGHRYSTWMHIRALSYRLPFRLRLVLQARGKDIAFAKDREKYMYLSRHFKNHAELEQERFDAILIGADIVWDFQMPALGQDPVYFGHFLNTKRLISFCPSVGPCDLSKEIPAYVEEGLRRFHGLSVRDAKTQELVKKVIDVESPILCDPAFHLNVTNLLKELETDEQPERPYLLVYLINQFCDDAFIAEIKAFARERKLRIISTLYSNTWADEDRVAHGPMEWLRLIADADCIVTNTFHGAVFSIMLKKNFVVKYTPLIQSKTEGMLVSLGLQERVVGLNGSISDILTERCDYHSVSAKVTDMKKIAENFLSEHLNSLPKI